MSIVEHNVLIIGDDRQSVRDILSVLARKGIRGLVAGTLKEAGHYLEKDSLGLVFCEVSLNDQHRIFTLIDRIRRQSPELPVILLGQPDQNQDGLQEWFDLTVKSANIGCCSILLKPLDISRVENILDTMLPNRSVAATDIDHFQQVPCRIVGKSSNLLQTIDLAKKIAATSMPVLISGENGTGKELIASLIHHSSRRIKGPYVQVNCAALNDTLLESEMFGHEKGAFTGAHVQRKGRFELAHGGTLLLDEITETPIKFQATLLRVLEQQDFERVGGSDSIQVNVRIISTTNRDMAEEVSAGRFRQDLYYRLCGIRLIVPPLRQRLDDLEDLVWYFVNLYSHQTNRRITQLSDEMMELFRQYHWPGNVRQLRNVVRTSLVLGSGSVLSLADASWIFDDLQPCLQKESNSSGTDASPEISDLGGLPLAQVERFAILDTLKQTSGNQTKAAKILGISDRTLRDKIRRYREQQRLQPA